MVGAQFAHLTGLLTSRGVAEVYHYVPLHYLMFIARSRALLSKGELGRLGFNNSHFRRTSRSQDELRGFSHYVHLTVTAYPPILAAKLASGFPHFEVRVPAAHVEKTTLHLCRYNIAKSRNLRTGKKPAPESAATGRYHGAKQIPTAETVAECEALLQANLGENMIEVLVPNALILPPETALIFFDENDRDLADELIHPMKLNWALHLAKDLTYKAATGYVRAVKEFLARARVDPGWKGNGLDFDSV